MGQGSEAELGDFRLCGAMASESHFLYDATSGSGCGSKRGARIHGELKSGGEQGYRAYTKPRRLRHRQEN